MNLELRQALKDLICKICKNAFCDLREDEFCSDIIKCEETIELLNSLIQRRNNKTVDIEEEKIN